jgi:hypothetical protein
MKTRSPILNRIPILLVLAGLFPAPTLFAADLKPQPLVCVSLFSETSDGSISFRTGKGEWTVIKVGDTIPAAAEIRINVAQDWMELTPAADPTTVFWMEGSETGEVVKKVADVLKSKSRTVSFPKVSKDTDPAFKDKLVVKQLLGRQVYRANADTPDKDIRYGDQLDIKGRVRIIGINNTLVLAFPNGAVTTVVGPLSFDVQKVFTGSNLYKYLNVAK